MEKQITTCIECGNKFETSDLQILGFIIAKMLPTCSDCLMKRLNNAKSKIEAKDTTKA